MSSNPLARGGGILQSGSPEAPRFRSQAAQEECRDPVMEQLVGILLSPQEADEVLRGFYTDAFHAALLQRLADLRGSSDSRSGHRKTARLATWRLKRVNDYVGRNLHNRLSLAVLAATAGLSSMYFAAQFRLATGMRPHDYVVRQRVQRAKAMLAETSAPIVDVALSVGFQSQSHFTTVFKRIVGFTPQHWRAIRARQGDAAHRAGAESKLSKM